MAGALGVGRGLVVGLGLVTTKCCGLLKLVGVGLKTGGRGGGRLMGVGGLLPGAPPGGGGGGGGGGDEGDNIGNKGGDCMMMTMMLVVTDLLVAAPHVEARGP